MIRAAMVIIITHMVTTTITIIMTMIMIVVAGMIIRISIIMKCLI